MSRGWRSWLCLAALVATGAGASPPEAGPPPPTIAPGVEVGRWLEQRPALRTALRWERPDGTVAAYDAWPDDMRGRLATLVKRIGSGAAPDLPAAPPLQPPAEAGTPFPPLTPELARWSAETARETYLAYAAQSLAVEIGGWVPWSIEADPPAVLALLLDSRSLWRADPVSGGYRIPFAFGATTPGDPYREFLFLRAHDLIGATSRETIERLIGWVGEHVVHFRGDWDAANVYATWQYHGWPPLERVLAGTIDARDPNAGVARRSGACFGTVGVLRLLGRTVNIPVELLHPCPGHGLPHFVREDLFLSHGDDPYSSLLATTPPIPPAALLIDRTRYDAWLAGDEVSITRCKNIGRQVRELALRHLTDELLAARCADRAAGVAPDRGTVYERYRFDYSLAELERLGLWTRLDEKIAARGGCEKIPPGR